MNRLEELKKLREIWIEQVPGSSKNMFNRVTSALLELKIEELEAIENTAFHPKNVSHVYVAPDKEPVFLNFDNKTLSKITFDNDHDLDFSNVDPEKLFESAKRQIKELIDDKNCDCSSIHPTKGIDFEKEYKKSFAILKNNRKEMKLLTIENRKLREKLFALEVLEDKILEFNAEGWKI